MTIREHQFDVPRVQMLLRFACIGTQRGSHVPRYSWRGVENEWVEHRVHHTLACAKRRRPGNERECTGITVGKHQDDSEARFAGRKAQKHKHKHKHKHTSYCSSQRQVVNIPRPAHFSIQSAASRHHHGARAAPAKLLNTTCTSTTTVKCTRIIGETAL